MATEIQGKERTEHCLWTLVHMDNAKSRTSKRNLVIIEELHFKRTAHSFSSFDIASPDFFLWVAERRARFSIG
jgi:hypothetical protein